MSEQVNKKDCGGVIDGWTLNKAEKGEILSLVNNVVNKKVAEAGVLQK